MVVYSILTLFMLVGLYFVVQELKLDNNSSDLK
jgi:hypothetical protein